MTIDDLVTEEVTVEQVVEAYVRHQPQSQRGPVPLKNWFDRYDIRTGKHTKRAGHGNKYCQKWRQTDRKTDFDEWIKLQIPPELTRRLEQTPHFVQQETTIEATVKAYIKHDPRNKMGNPVPLKNWFASYDITAGKYTKNSQGRKHYDKWQRTCDNLEFDEFILKQISPELAKKLKQTSYFQQQEITIEDVIKAYIKHQPKSQQGLVPLKNWFAIYDTKTGKIREKNGQGNKYYQQWRQTARKTEFEAWIKKQISPELAQLLEQTQYYTQQETTIEDVIKAYIKHKPQSERGPVPLKSWFRKYDIETRKRTGKGQGNKYYARWLELNKKTEFDEWVLKQASEPLQNEYMQALYGISHATEVLRALVCAIKKQPIKLEAIRSEPVKKMLTAYYIEKDIHPEIKKFSPYETMIYLNTRPEEREEQLKIRA